MTRMLSVAVFSMMLLASAASAATPTFVKSSGSDANPCTLASPCRNFSAAITAVDAGGQVVALDSANYGTMSITKALTIYAPIGIYAGVHATSGNAVSVAAGSSDVVILRGITISGNGATSGVVYTAGAAVHLENVVINGFNSHGVDASTGQVYVKDSVIRDCGGTGVSASSSSVSIEGTRFERISVSGSSCAVSASTSAKITVRDSEASGSSYGFCANGSSSELNLWEVKAANNINTGVGCYISGSTVRTAGVSSTNNATGFSQGSSCTFESLGNSLVRGNSTNVSGTITVVSGN